MSEIFDHFISDENFELAWRRIQHSVRYEVKDWLGLQVYGVWDHTRKHLNLIQEDIKNGYKPLPVLQIRRPKPDRSLRTFSFLSMDDRILYQALGNTLIANSYSTIEKLSEKRRIYAHIPTPPHKMSSYVFRRPFDTFDQLTNTRTFGQYDNFLRDILSTRRILVSDRNARPWMIKTDIASFYPTIDHNKLIKLLEYYGWLSDRTLLDLLSSCLDTWRLSSQPRGIPIGYEASDHLANLYLFPLDQALSKFQVKRYVDDIYIFASSIGEVKEVLSILDDILEKLELYRNSSKTEIILLKDFLEEDLREKIGTTLSHLQNVYITEEAEGNRQRELLRVARENYVAPQNHTEELTHKNILDASQLAFALYRIKVADNHVRDAALCLLDHYPHYSIHATKYLRQNQFAQDHQVRERLRGYLINKYEPIELRRNCLIALMFLIGFQSIEHEVESIFEDQESDWFLKYSALRDVVEYHLDNVSGNYLAHLLQRDNEHILVRSLAFVYAFAIYDDKDIRTQIINMAFATSNLFIQKLGIYLWRRYTDLDVQFSRLPMRLIERFVPKQTQSDIEECREILRDLFDIPFPTDFPFEDILGNLSSLLPLLRTARDTQIQGADEFISNVYRITLRFLNGYLQKTLDPITDLEVLRKQYFDNDLFVDTAFLEDCWKDIQTGKSLRNGLQIKILGHIKPMYRHFAQKIYERRYKVPMRDQIFICYSRQDTEWRDRVQKHLKPYFRGTQITAWDDSHIKPGQDWDQQIKDALKRSKVAILLVTSNFTASDYILDNELPDILKASQKEGLIIVWIHVRPSSYVKIGLDKIQCAHGSPNPALEARSDTEQEEILVEIAKFVESVFE